MIEKNIKDEYIKLCEQLNDSFDSTDYGKHNRSMKKLEAFFKNYILKEPDKYKDALLSMLEHTDTRVCLVSATQLIKVGIYKEEAIAKLVEIIESNPNSYFVFDAENIIEYVAKLDLNKAKKIYRNIIKKSKK